MNKEEVSIKSFILHFQEFASGLKLLRNNFIPISLLRTVPAVPY
jgi:hypothetical protein